MAASPGVPNFEGDDEVCENPLGLADYGANRVKEWELSLSWNEFEWERNSTFLFKYHERMWIFSSKTLDWKCFDIFSQKKAI